MSEASEFLAEYQGKIVPRAFDSGFVVLSYLVSFVGAACTLELINRRTSQNGVFNTFMLVGSAITMGGIAIWCMHFIGNKAILLGNGEPELYIAYSAAFTALSFFIPILVLLVAFIAIGASNTKIAWWRTPVGGILAGGAICGMHYVGNASIANYHCIYQTGNVVGAAVISVLASTVALGLFFVSRASWTNSWWKRMISGFVLAGAVSGMHWCASVGTSYQLISLADVGAHQSQTTTVIVVICLSVGAGLIIAATAIYTARVMRRYAVKAQQIVLAAAVFDQAGRVMVNIDGLLPSEKITDTYVEKVASDSLGLGNALFHWMYQASRNWEGLQSIIQSMEKHIQELSKNDKNHDVRLIDGDGHPIDNYGVIFKELFCVAAANLANDMKQKLTDVGILWDEIMPTGSAPNKCREDSGEPQDPEKDHNAVEKGEGWRQKNQQYGRGSLMFLVRRVEEADEVEKLEAAGFRFADVNQVCNIIGSKMQIQIRDLSGKLSSMASYAGNTMLEPGVHLGFFALKATVNSDNAFDVLARKDARSLLPSQRLPLDELEEWQEEFIQRLDRLNVVALLRQLDKIQKPTPKEKLFASQLYDAVESLRAWIDDPVFNNAHLVSSSVQVPCQPRSTDTNATITCTMITLQLVVPIHTTVNSPKCEFVPLNFFKVAQRSHKDSPSQVAFPRIVHREVSPVVNQALLNPSDRAVTATGRSGFLAKILRLAKPGSPGSKSQTAVVDGKPLRGHSRTSSASTSSILKMREQAGVESRGHMFESPTADGRDSRQADTPQPHTPQPAEYGGIMISQEVKVDRRAAARARQNSRRMGKKPSIDNSGRESRSGSSAGVFGHFGRKDSSRGTEQQQNELTAATENEQRATAAHDEERAAMKTFVDTLCSLCVDGGRGNDNGGYSRPGSMYFGSYTRPAVPMFSGSHRPHPLVSLVVEAGEGMPPDDY